MPKRRMVRVIVCIPREWDEEIKRMVRRGVYPSKSEAIRYAVGAFLLKKL